MKQALILVSEIKRMREAITKTRSKHLINDYKKSISRNIQDLKEYCSYRGINFEELNV